MKRYILAVMGSLLLNFLLIGFISMHWVDDIHRTPSVELVFDDSEGTLFHDDIGSNGLEYEGENASDRGGNGGKTAAGPSGLPEKASRIQEERKAVIRIPLTGKNTNDTHESKKIGEPSNLPEMKTSSAKSMLGRDEKSLQSSQTVSDNDKDQGKTEPAKSVNPGPVGGHENSSTGPSGTGNGNAYGAGEKGHGGTGEGSGKKGNDSGGFGSGSGSGEGSGSGDPSSGGLEQSTFNPPVPIREVNLEYPKEARDKGWEGRVYLKLTVNLKGRVVDVKILESSGYEILDKEAIKAAKMLRYKPATRNGTLVEWHLNKAFIFKLQ